MAEVSEVSEVDKLEKCKEDIAKTGLAKLHADSLEKHGISVDYHLRPSMEWKKIKYYNGKVSLRHQRANFENSSVISGYR